MHETATTAKADVVFPLETHAEKDGTVTHPDGRLQRVRPSASRPGDIRPNIQVLAELSSALGHDTGIDSQPSAFAALTNAVPFYSGIDDADHRRSRYPLARHPRFRASAQGERRCTLRTFCGGGAEPAPEASAVPPHFDEVPSEEGAPALALGTYRDLWAGPITELNPPLKFLSRNSGLSCRWPTPSAWS